MACTTAELRQKDVVNINNGKKLGNISDLEFETECGRITAFLVSGGSFISFIFSKKQIRIPTEKVINIGIDTVLVDYKENDDACNCCTDRQKWGRSKNN